MIAKWGNYRCIWYLDDCLKTSMLNNLEKAFQARQRTTRLCLEEEDKNARECFHFNRCHDTLMHGNTLKYPSKPTAADSGSIKIHQPKHSLVLTGNLANPCGQTPPKVITLTPERPTQLHYSLLWTCNPPTPQTIY